MRKILLVVLVLGAGQAFALTQASQRDPIATYQPSRIRLTGTAADDLFASLPVDAQVSRDGGTVTKEAPGVKCTFTKAEDSGFCDVELTQASKEKVE